MLANCRPNMAIHFHDASLLPRLRKAKGSRATAEPPISTSLHVLLLACLFSEQQGQTDIHQDNDNNITYTNRFKFSCDLVRLPLLRRGGCRRRGFGGGASALEDGVGRARLGDAQRVPEPVAENEELAVAVEK